MPWSNASSLCPLRLCGESILKISSLTKKFSKARVLVIGDLILDRYLWGEVSRISPEAPVPVVRVRERSEALGGAGNVAANLAGLKVGVTLIGLCGNDEPRMRLKAMLDKKGIAHHLLTDSSRPTITKSRIMAQGQQVLRLDEEEPFLLSPWLHEELFSLIEKTLSQSRTVILSDYGKGLHQTPGITRRIINLCKEHSIPVLVDPKGKDWERYQGATCVTPNSAELELVSSKTIGTDERQLMSAARATRRKYSLDWLLVTRGPKGMCLVGGDNGPLHIPAQAREVYDVSGAGDTVIATLGAGVASGLSFPDAALLANAAAGVVVGKLGTQPITLPELNAVLQITERGNQTGRSGKIATRSAARMQVQAWRTSGERIVFTNGCFDLLHPGHIHLLHESRALGERLVVGLNTDASVRRLKGPTRPIVSEEDRAAVLSALTCVDLVVPFREDTPLSLIKALRPDILVKGGDYRPETVVGREIVESYGGHVRLIPLLEGYSTTTLAHKAATRTK